MSAINIKKIILPIFSIFLIYRTIEMMKMLVHSNAPKFGVIESLLISFLIVLFITGIFAFIGFAYPSNRLMPDSYYKVRDIKALTSAYKLLGIKYFRSVLLITFWGKENNRKKYFDGTKSGLENFIFQTKQSEFGHLGAFGFVFIVSVILLCYGHILMFIVITMVNVIGNFYPIVLQRYHRTRIERIMKSLITKTNNNIIM